MFHFFCDQRGIAALETVLIATVLLFLSVIGVEIGYLIDAQVDVAAVSREAGRVAAMADSAEAGRSRAYDTARERGLDPSRLDVNVRREGAAWIADVTYRYRFLAPRAGKLIGVKGGNVWGEETRILNTSCFRRESP